MTRSPQKKSIGNYLGPYITRSLQVSPKVPRVLLDSDVKAPCCGVVGGGGDFKAKKVLRTNRAALYNLSMCLGWYRVECSGLRLQKLLGGV